MNTIERYTEDDHFQEGINLIQTLQTIAHEHHTNIIEVKNKYDHIYKKLYDEATSRQATPDPKHLAQQATIRTHTYYKSRAK